MVQQAELQSEKFLQFKNVKGPPICSSAMCHPSVPLSRFPDCSQSVAAVAPPLRCLLACTSSTPLLHSCHTPNHCHSAVQSLQLAESFTSTAAQSCSAPLAHPPRPTDLPSPQIQILECPQSTGSAPQGWQYSVFRSFIAASIISSSPVCPA